MHTYRPTCTNIHTCTHKWTHIYTYNTHVHTHTHSIHKYTPCTHEHTQAHVRTHAHTQHTRVIHTCVLTCIYTHAQMHTHIRQGQSPGHTGFCGPCEGVSFVLCTMGSLEVWGRVCHDQRCVIRWTGYENEAEEEVKENPQTSIIINYLGGFYIVTNQIVLGVWTSNDLK